ncbi:DNA-binding protein [Streptomyces sp. XM4193]|uniref:DNA-binding protein n=1 Tax=Streptomyces sp. XM4193 TaxID=2929782 RepID=UPI001FF81AAA|nr:DNA-binding protein [Streptomyces sp. XM4193]MCK1794636.1 DNA-binding protein [Streptomyces sp. XM4193]
MENAAQQQSGDPFVAPHPEQARAERVYASLFRIAERHAATAEQRARQAHPSVLGPHEAVRLVSFLLSGAAKLDEDEPEVDRSDITAALSLVPLMRGEMDELEAGLLRMARGRGMTWPDVAFGLGLATPQAARQRCARLAERTHDAGSDGRSDAGVAAPSAGAATE